MLRTVGATTVGQAGAHWLAFSLAAKLIDMQDDRAVLRQLLVQVSAAAVVAVLPAPLLAALKQVAG